jgi:hypothetical protein
MASAADQVSAQVAALLSEHGLGYQQVSAQIANFHDQFVQAMSAGANAYTAAETNAAQTLASAVNSPAATLLGPLGAGAGVGPAGGIAGVVGGGVSNAVNRIESAVLGSNFLGGAGLLGGGNLPGVAGLLGGGNLAGVAGLLGGSDFPGVAGLLGGGNFPGLAGLLGGSNFPGLAGLLEGGGAAAIASQAGALLGPTGAVRALTAASAVLTPVGMTNAAAVPAAFGDGIKASYNLIEPYVQYGFEVAAYAVGWVPWVGWLAAPQILFFYDLFEPMVQSGLFNILDWLGGSITFAQGLNNFFAATTASINYFIQTEINWFFSFLPPLPPLPPFFP